MILYCIDVWEGRPLNRWKRSDVNVNENATAISIGMDVMQKRMYLVDVIAIVCVSFRVRM